MPDLETQQTIMQTEAYWDAPKRQVLGQGACEAVSRSFEPLFANTDDEQDSRTVRYVSDDNGVRLEVDPA